MTVANKPNTQNLPKKNPGKLSKVLGWFKKLPSKIARPFKNTWHELNLVTWPTKNELINYSIVVLVFVVAMSIVIGVLDTGATALIRVIIQINET